jgi:hypothetical protein
LLFDVAAWATGTATGILLYRWRLAEVTATVARVADRGYFIALAAGAVCGAYVSGSFTFWSQGVFALAHSVAGALIGAIAAVELYKLARGIRLSTGIIFVGPFAAGVAIGRWGSIGTTKNVGSGCRSGPVAPFSLASFRGPWFPWSADSRPPAGLRR